MVCVDTKTEIFEKGGKNKNISIKKWSNSDIKKKNFHINKYPKHLEKEKKREIQINL
jgi:hypothetical protein